MQRPGGCAIALLSGLLAVAQAAEPRPNLVFILADDLGYSDLGCYGGEIETPHLDRLAKQGLRFSQFYNTAKCHSSRVCLLTGLYCHQAGNQSLRHGVTVAQVLGRSGYFTAMAGKWHLDDEPTDWGFQRYFGHLSGATNFFTGDKTFRLNGQRFTDFGDDFYTTDANTDYAMRFVDEAVDAKKPFFLYLAYNAPHYPLQAPQAEVQKYRGKYRMGWDRLRQVRYDRQLKMGLVPSKWPLSPRPQHVPAWDSLDPEQRDWEDFRMAAFAGMVDRLDQNIGRLIAHLQSVDALDNTVVLFCSDNGACPFERTRGREYMPWDARSYWTYDTGWAHAGNTPFRWYKQNQHEGGVSSPLIVHWPAGLTARSGAITGQPAHLIDLMATAVDLTGATYPHRWDGREITPLQGKSLLPIFRGQEREEHDYLYFQFSSNRAIRQGQWKLVSARGGPWELYDMEADRTELQNLAQQQPQRVEDLKQLWFDAAADVDHAPEKLRKPVNDQIQPWPVKPRRGR